MIRLLLSIALAVALLSPAWAELSELEEYTAKRAEYMLEWIGRKRPNYNTSVPLVMEFRPLAELRAIYRGAGAASGSTDQLRAFHMGGVIFLPLDFRRRVDDYMLLHELVHVVQFHNGRTAAGDARDRCQLELEAYELQIEWARGNSGYIPSDMWMFGLEACANSMDY